MSGHICLLAVIKKILKKKKITAKKKSHAAPSCIEAQDGSILIEKDKILKRWKEYIGSLNELFADDRGANYHNHTNGVD